MSVVTHTISFRIFRMLNFIVGPRPARRILTLAELRRPPFYARIRLADQMHMKVYWVEREGFVITSANLPRRALGSGIREEIGVFIDDPTLLDIDQIIERLSSRPLKRKELKAMQLRHDAYWAAHVGESKAKARRMSSYHMA
jgi:phosphatidylserine/phosphatidylglycerophosphate/cardiolipin synthase-like enzyme